MLLGCGDQDDAADGLEVDLHVGDVIVLPAGTGHCNLRSTADYRYIGVYPEVSLIPSLLVLEKNGGRVFGQTCARGEM